MDTPQVTTLPLTSAFSFPLQRRLGFQRQRVTCGVSMIVETNDDLAVARV